MYAWLYYNGAYVIVAIFKFARVELSWLAAGICYCQCSPNGSYRNGVCRALWAVATPFYLITMSSTIGESFENKLLKCHVLKWDTCKWIKLNILLLKIHYIQNLIYRETEMGRSLSKAISYHIKCWTKSVTNLWSLMQKGFSVFGVIHNLRRQRIGREGFSKCLHK